MKVITRLMRGLVGEARYISLRRKLSRWQAETLRGEFAYFEPEHKARYFETVVQRRIDQRVKVDQPMVLVSQAVRSGGTLFSRLLDLHPNLHTYPYELLIGYPDKHLWPTFDTTRPNFELWFRQLHSRRLLDMALNGFTLTDGEEPRPFIQIPPLQREIFDLELQAANPITQRDILNAYMTSYFNAWLDNHNLYVGNKKYVPAFVPRLSSNPESMPRYFEAYPDGRFITLIRDPRDWYASARYHWDPRWNAPIKQAPKAGWPIEETIKDGWLAASEAALRVKQQRPEQTLILRFEDLLAHTELLMRYVTDWLGIPFIDSLLQPTFNGMPIASNSTYGMQAYKISTEPIGRYKKRLSPEEIQQIEVLALNLYHSIEPLGDLP